ncbi:mCG1050954 [Mus musculus]|nr:mCG1050954 [Mus musculus]
MGSSSWCLGLGFFPKILSAGIAHSLGLHCLGGRSSHIILGAADSQVDCKHKHKQRSFNKPGNSRVNNGLQLLIHNVPSADWGGLVPCCQPSRYLLTLLFLEERPSEADEAEKPRTGKSLPGTT